MLILSRHQAAFFMDFIVLHHRDKCIACHYCVDVASELFEMDINDGKAILIDSNEKKGFFSLKIMNAFSDSAKQAQNVCPVNIIDVRPLR